MAAEGLLSTSRFAIFSVQISGYFPISIAPKRSREKNHQTVQFSWSSASTILSFIGLSVIVGWTLLYYIIFKNKITITKMLGPTEQFAYSLIVVIGCFIGVVLRVAGFRQDFSNFFEHHDKLLENFEKVGIGVGGEMNKIRRYIRASFFAYFFPLSIHCILIHVARPWFLYRKYGKWLPDIVYMFGSGVWVYFSYLMISNLWIILFPRIYSGLYKEISRNIRQRLDKSVGIVWYSQEIQRKPMTKGGIAEKAETRVDEYLNLILQLGRMIEEFNKVFAEMLLFEMIFCIGFIILYAFFGCFWVAQGQIRVIGEILTPLYVNGKKLVELGYSCGNISREAQMAMKSLIQYAPLDGISVGTIRKIQLLQIQLESKPPTVSAKQFFTISRGSVTTVLSGMAGFLVALVQFRQQDGQ